jgi:DNA-directed RNA polymerase specialized sigma24 family protein
MTDDLLRRLSDGEDAAWQDLVAHCRTRLRPFVQARMPNASDTDDLVSDVIAEAWRAIRGGKRPEVLHAWLMGITRHLLIKRYGEKARGGAELPDDLPRPAGDVQLDLERTDMPEVPSDWEMLTSRRQLWATVVDATKALSPGHATVMRTHIRLTWERGKFVRGKELAEALGQPVKNVDRQLDRARKAELDAIAALVVARSGGGGCADLARTLTGVLRPEQRDAGRKLVLDPAQAAAVLGHTAGCAACTPAMKQARDFSRYALGPGLLGLAGEDDERRRAIAAMLDRVAEAPLAEQSSAASALAVVPAPLAATDAPRVLDRVRQVLTTRVVTLPRTEAVVQFAQQNPDAFRRVLAAAIVGVTLVAGVIFGLLSPTPGGPPAAAGQPPAQEVPGVAPGPSADPPTTTTSPTVPAAASTPLPAPVQQPLPTTTTSRSTASSSTSTTSTATTTTTVRTAPKETVEVDATGIDYPLFAIVGETDWLDTRHIQQLRLPRGRHTLRTRFGQEFAFEVTGSGRLGYDPALEGRLTGANGTTLTLHGVPVTVDVTEVDYGSSGVSGTISTTARRHTYNLLPALHYLIINNGRSLFFTVTPDGKVAYQPEDAGLLTGTGSDTLTVHGLPVVVDVSGVDYGSTGVGGTPQTKDRRHTYRLLPGPHYLVVNGPSVFFTVTRDGKVDRPDPPSLATGAGTDTLTVHGLAVTVDVSGVDYEETGVGGIPQTRDRRHTYRLVPGRHYLVTNGTRSVFFTITGDGKVDRPDPPSLATGAGTDTLTVYGLSITIDARESGYPTFWVSGAGAGRDARQLQDLRLLPGSHYVTMPDRTRLVFTVTGAGTVDYDHSLDGVLFGRGGSTLVVRRQQG